MKIDVNKSTFVMIDIQDRFVKHIKEMPQIIKNASLLNRFSEIIGIPLLVTEQIPEKLGKTVDSIYFPQKHKLFKKSKFSIFEPEITNHLIMTGRKQFEKIGLPHLNIQAELVFYGIETHVCVLQSVVDAVDLGFRPIVVADAVSSISPTDKETALRRIESMGATLVSTEMLLFELLGDAKHPNFKQVSQLIKENKKG